MKFRMKGAALAIGLATGSMILGGCTTGADGKYIISGRVIDAITGSPIADAHVQVMVEGKMKDAHTDEQDVNDGVADMHTGGYFSIEVDQGGSYMMMVHATGYGTMEKMQSATTLTSTQTETAVSFGYINDLGDIPMGRTHDVTIAVVDTGAAVADATVSAMHNSWDTNNCPESSNIPTGWMAPTVTGTTGAATPAEGETTGEVTLTLNQCVMYDFVVPSRVDENNELISRTVVDDGDGNHAVAGGPGVDSFTASLGDRYVIALDALETTSTATEIASSFDSPGLGTVNFDVATDLAGSNGTRQTFTSGMTMTSGNQYIVFDRPVAIADTGAMRIVSRNPLTNPDGDDDAAEDATYNDRATIDATFALDSTGTILNITAPTDGFPANRVYNIDGEVYVNLPGGDFDIVTIDRTVLVTDSGASGLASDSTITLDNYNGETGLGVGGGSSTPGTIWLEFPEAVIGNYRILSRTNKQGTDDAGGADDVTTVLNSSSATLPAGAYVFTDGKKSTDTPACTVCGTGAGTKYAVPISVGVDTDGDTVVIYLDVEDTDGNRFTDEVTLTVE